MCGFRSVISNRYCGSRRTHARLDAPRPASNGSPAWLGEQRPRLLVRDSQSHRDGQGGIRQIPVVAAEGKSEIEPVLTLVPGPSTGG
jgi:hypothetical protein